MTSRKPVSIHAKRKSALARKKTISKNQSDAATKRWESEKGAEAREAMTPEVRSELFQ